MIQYFGGKQRTAKDITTVMNQMIRKSQVYFEPFVGGASICAGMKAKKRVANDTNKYLIAMYKALQGKWQPPISVDENEYYAMKKLVNPDYKNQDGFGENMPDDWNPSPADIGFVGIACSFYGMWFGSYARDAKGVGKKGTGHLQNFAIKGYNTLTKDLRGKIKDVKFCSKSYDKFNPKNAFIYCDPPYSGTDQPYYTKTFDTDHFWDVMRKWASNPTNTIIISEYDAPDDFPCIVEIPTKTCIFVKDKRGDLTKADRVEKLFSQTKYDPFNGIF